MSNTAKVSLDRLTNFLRETELLDQYTHTDEDHATRDALLERPADDSVIGLRNVSFSWSVISSSASSVPTPTPSRRSFALHIPGELTFRRGAVNLIVGPTGSGKTSLLMALLGEMHCIRLTLDAWANLPRTCGVAYAAQESWVQNETIRDNILFGAAYDEARYKKGKSLQYVLLIYIFNLWCSHLPVRLETRPLALRRW